MAETTSTSLDLIQEITKIREAQAVQGQMLTQIMQTLNQQSQASAEQGAKIALLITDVTVVKNEVSTWRSEINGINAWRADSNNLFVPRKEHEAQRHEQRISELEKALVANATSKVQEVQHNEESKHSFLQWIAGNGLSMLTFLVMLTLTLINLLHR